MFKKKKQIEFNNVITYHLSVLVFLGTNKRMRLVYLPLLKYIHYDCTLLELRDKIFPLTMKEIMGDASTFSPGIKRVLKVSDVFGSAAAVGLRKSF